MSALPSITRNHKHCRFKLTAIDSVILVLPEGIWSRSCLDDYMRQIVLLRQQHVPGEFGCLVSTQKWELSPPDVLEKLTGFNEFAVSQGMVAQWLVGDSARLAHTRITEQFLKRAAPFLQISSELSDATDAFERQGLLNNKEGLTGAFSPHR